MRLDDFAAWLLEHPRVWVYLQLAACRARSGQIIRLTFK